MGIRVHKKLGYGLTNVQTNERGRIEDERINSDSPLLSYDDYPSNEDYLAWLKDPARQDEHALPKGMLDVWYIQDPGDRHVRDLSDVATHNSEFGMPNVLLLQPLGAVEQWSRYDDSIDWIEETYLRDEDERQANHVEVIRHAVYPHLNYMDKRDGRKLDDLVFTWWRGASGAHPNDHLDSLAQRLGFADHGEADANVVPMPPNEIRLVAEFTNLFTTEDVWRQLLPMLYVYWS